jgi:RHS repeat-associated protein
MALSRSRINKVGLSRHERLFIGYDAADDITKAPGTTNAFDEAGQIESATGATFTFDKEGDWTKATPASGPATSYSYDQAGRLTAIERSEEGGTPAISESFGYDGTDLLASRTVGLTTQHFVWDSGESPESLLSDGEDSYLYGPGGISFEQISSGGVPEYLHHDQLGSTRLLTNSSGEAEGTFTYGAYGVLTGHTGTSTTALGYAGKYTLGQSGLQYLRARFYDPATAQFMTVDPAVATTRSPYSYARSNPLRFYDPSGRITIGICVSGSIGGVTIFNGSACAQASSSGEVGATATGGPALGGGSGEITAGPGIEISNASHIAELSGPFVGGGGKIADGVGGYGEGFHSIPGCGSIGGVMAGPVVGAGYQPPFGCRANR